MIKKKRKKSIKLGATIYIKKRVKIKNLIVTVQGRLSISPKNGLQFFSKNWRKEFELANKIGLIL